MHIGEKIKAVVLTNGTIQCLSNNEGSIGKARLSALHSGHVTTVRDVVVMSCPSTKVQWVVVATFPDYTHEMLCKSRAEARMVVAHDKACGMPSHIERREYILINTQRVS